MCSGPGSAVRRSCARPSRRQHGDVEPVLQRHRPGHAEPGEQAAVGHAAAQEHVLAVVDHEAAAAERGGRPAQAGPGLGQRDVGAGLTEGDRGGDAGQAATDHDDLAGRAHRAAPFPAAAPAPCGRSATTSDRAATSAFSLADSDIRRSRTTRGGGGDPFQQPVVDAGHRPGRGRAAPVQQRDQRESLRVPGAGALRLELHQRRELVPVGPVARPVLAPCCSGAPGWSAPLPSEQPKRSKSSAGR